MTISSVGEFALIDRLKRSSTGTVLILVVGIGDDAAAWQPTPGTLTVATTDALIEGVHFDLSTTSWADLGWKALAENVSDVAAMGCRPRYALIALGLPDGVAVGSMEELYRGLQECATAFGCHVVGGDVVASPSVIISVTLLGESLPTSRGDDAPPCLGGQRLARRCDSNHGPARRFGRRLAYPPRRHAPPRCGHRRASPSPLAPDAPRRGGLALVEAGVRCAIDVSDGLVADVQHICERSGLDAEIQAESVPVHGAARAVFSGASLDMALSGGEDYELVCTGSAQTLARASDILVSRGEPPLVTLGRIVDRAWGLQRG